jgi:hypothetical protein
MGGTCSTHWENKDLKQNFNSRLYDNADEPSDFITAGNFVKNQVTAQKRLRVEN